MHFFHYSRCAKEGKTEHIWIIFGSLEIESIAHRGGFKACTFRKFQNISARFF